MCWLVNCSHRAVTQFHEDVFHGIKNWVCNCVCVFVFVFVCVCVCVSTNAGAAHKNDEERLDNASRPNDPGQPKEKDDTKDIL